MSCSDCEKMDEQGGVYWYRFGAATIGIIACKKHFIEVRDLLERRLTLWESIKMRLSHRKNRQVLRGRRMVDWSKVPVNYGGTLEIEGDEEVEEMME